MSYMYKIAISRVLTTVYQNKKLTIERLETLEYKFELRKQTVNSFANTISCMYN